VSSRYADHVLTGTTAARPAATTVPAGTLYASSTDGVIYQSSGSAWGTWLAAPADPAVITINAQTGTTYTLVLTDAGKLVTLSNASAITLTVPTNASVAYTTGTQILLAQLGAGQVTVAAAGGVTVSSRSAALKIAGQYGAATLIKTATDTWLLTGDIST